MNKVIVAWRPVPAALAALVWLLAASSDLVVAQSLVHELKLGVLHHDTPGLWSGFQRERTAADINVELILSPGFAFLGGTIRPAIGGSVNTRGDTSKGYLDARWQIESPAGLFLGLGIGVAVHDGHTAPSDADRKALGSRVLFHFPVEAGLRLDARSSVSIYFDHVSNGYTQRFNEGLDTIGLRYGYRF